MDITNRYKVIIINYLERITTGVIMSGLFSLCILVFAGCTKDKDVDPGIPPTALTWTLSPNTAIIIGEGSVVHFSWTSNGDSTVLELSSGERFILGCSGTKALIFYETTNAKWLFYKAGVHEIQELTITVTETIPPPDFTFTATPNHLGVGGGDVIFTVSGVTNCDSVTSPNIPGVHGAGLFTVNVTQTDTFYVTGWGKGGTNVKSIQITVDPLPILTPFLDAIIKYPWALTSAKGKCSYNDPWYDLFLIPSNTKYVYSRDGFLRMYENGILISQPWPFSLSELDSTLTIVDIHYKIHFIDTTMMLERENEVTNFSCDDGLAYQLEIYTVTALKK